MNIKKGSYLIGGFLLIAGLSGLLLTRLSMKHYLQSLDPLIPLVAAFLLVAAGFVLIIFRYRENKRVSNIINPDIPWLSQESWALNRMIADKSEASWTLGGLAIIFGLSSVLIGYKTINISEEDSLVVLLLFLVVFSSITVSLVKAAYTGLKIKKLFGIQILSLDPFPGLIGDTIAGHIDIDTFLQHNAKFLINVKCIENVKTRTRKDTITRKKTIWKGEVIAEQTQISQNKVRLIFSLPVPDGLPYSNTNEEINIKPIGSGNSITNHYWLLELKADLATGQLDAVFDIPVFKSANENFKPEATQNNGGWLNNGNTSLILILATLGWFVYLLISPSIYNRERSIDFSSKFPTQLTHCNGVIGTSNNTYQEIKSWLNTNQKNWKPTTGNVDVSKASFKSPNFIIEYSQHMAGSTKRVIVQYRNKLGQWKRFQTQVKGIPFDQADYKENTHTVFNRKTPTSPTIRKEVEQWDHSCFE